MRRNYARIGKPCKIGGFVISIISFLIVLAGPCLTISLILLSNRTMTGQLTEELIGLGGPILFTFTVSWFIARVYTGAIRVSLNTVLLSAACDEEMFTREQRFVEADLLDFMDGIGEEQNEQHRENKIRAKVEGGYAKDSNIMGFDNDDSTKPYFSKVLPSRSQWSDANQSRISKSSRAETPDLRVLTEVSEKPSNLVEIQEVSIEDDYPHITVGIPARFVDDQ